MDDLRDIWVYLSASPLLHLTLTLAAFLIGTLVYKKSGSNSLANPVFLAVALLVALLLVTGTSYQDYFDGAQFVHFLLGPATVALAVPLYRQFERIRRSAVAIAVSLLTGSLTAILSALTIGYLLDGSRDALASLAAKSVTAPVAMGISERLGGLPSLTAVLVIVTGIFGAMVGPLVLTLIGIRDPAARGLGLGTASHGIGTARAFQETEIAGAFSGLAMGLNALATAILLPLIWRLVT
ncbi:LrgB family protein [Rhodobium gokarnense]|uniref:Murein hydrolase (TIGR00659 family) n=1 Tax=Rhodobium gokarnense TaxID=364296 RepID=A0ABT3H5Y2_9HYPH|nr:LrgB family protein [Rhodobium gokarnense]MCW2305731.1 putative murein hydrolase (TIGR00659 family) [Rhodobium gokarnense]